ncbi:MAG TPA: Uma2 family endonuclease [Thermoanaerobaculia bacterium]|nr:Uma2 family endonuclease [Thermoanaerobaculia bacterium]
MALLHKDEDRLITGEELFRRPELGPCELVSGKIVPMAPTGFIHGDAELELGMRLRAYAKETGLGRVVGGDVGVYLRRNPDTVRAPDILFISKERYARRRKSPGYLEVVPELVVEVLSPANRPGEIAEKLADYFAAGVIAVWVLNPEVRRVSVYRSPRQVRHLGEGDVLSDEALLPGFSVPVAELFLE